MIVFYLCMKEMPLDLVHDDLVHTLGGEAMAYSTVTKSAWSTNFVPKENGPSSARMETTLTAINKGESQVRRDVGSDV
jgi:hypothetical protein